MKLLEYGDWTIFVPFFTYDRIMIYRGHRLPPPRFGVLYFVQNNKITNMHQCNLGLQDWAHYQIGELDRIELSKILNQEHLYYAD